MATPIIRTKLCLSHAEQKRMSAEIKERIKTDGFLMLDSYCELLGVIQDDGTFMPYLPDATYALSTIKAAQVCG